MKIKGRKEERKNKKQNKKIIVEGKKKKMLTLLSSVVCTYVRCVRVNQRPYKKKRKKLEENLTITIYGFREYKTLVHARIQRCHTAYANVEGWRVVWGYGGRFSQLYHGIISYIVRVRKG